MGLICQCGCGGFIPERPHHKEKGYPKYLPGHNAKSKTKEVDRSTSGAICKCGCNQIIEPKPHHRYVGTPDCIWGHNSKGQQFRSEASKRAMGNRNRRKDRIMRHGYWYVYVPEHPYATRQGHVAEHRLILEHKIGRYLDPKEVAHHINGNKTDNRPENLELLVNQREHVLKHKEIRVTEVVA